MECFGRFEEGLKLGIVLRPFEGLKIGGHLLFCFQAAKYFARPDCLERGLFDKGKFQLSVLIVESG